jgi:glucosamine--fructose-6-phosphate aminotransferase (isomerizing)
MEMKELGASTFSLAENGGDISFVSGLEECTRTILYLPLLQIMAYFRSLAKGLDPDKPKNLSSVIYLD